MRWCDGEERAAREREGVSLQARWMVKATSVVSRSHPCNVPTIFCNRSLSCVRVNSPEGGGPKGLGRLSDVSGSAARLPMRLLPGAPADPIEVDEAPAASAPRSGVRSLALDEEPGPSPAPPRAGRLRRGKQHGKSVATSPAACSSSAEGISWSSSSSSSVVSL